MFSELHDSVISHLIQEFDRLKASVEFCSYHIHIHCSGGNRFWVKWSTSEHKDYSSNPTSTTIAMLHFEVLPELSNGHVMLQVRPCRTRLHQGERKKTYEGYDWYCQDWRHEKFMVAADARVLWVLLEANADMSKIATEVMDS